MVVEKIGRIADHPGPGVKGNMQNSVPNLSPLVSTGNHLKGVGPTLVPHANAARKRHTCEGQKNPELLPLMDLSTHEISNGGVSPAARSKFTDTPYLGQSDYSDARTLLLFPRFLDSSCCYHYARIERGHGGLRRGRSSLDAPSAVPRGMARAYSDRLDVPPGHSNFGNPAVPETG
ncbi:hypothetical protein NDU88_005430 [Pleurodeles waltl]|uniref:Uncharacterized protein n=1 Tax=Pleurodeles waltl TaxID=8319 RepID=A0AAV7NWM7_PLEWA|nr:hypothetical protein NDU88_005430 [Pleurodeles waltl]